MCEEEEGQPLSVWVDGTAIDHIFYKGWWAGPIPIPEENI